MRFLYLSILLLQLGFLTRCTDSENVATPRDETPAPEFTFWDEGVSADYPFAYETSIATYTPGCPDDCDETRNSYSRTLILTKEEVSDGAELTGISDAIIISSVGSSRRIIDAYDYDFNFSFNFVPGGVVAVSLRVYEAYDFSNDTYTSFAQPDGGVLVWFADPVLPRRIWVNANLKDAGYVKGAWSGTPKSINR